MHFGYDVLRHLPLALFVLADASFQGGVNQNCLNLSVSVGVQQGDGFRPIVWATMSAVQNKRQPAVFLNGLFDAVPDLNPARFVISGGLELIAEQVTADNNSMMLLCKLFSVGAFS